MKDWLASLSLNYQFIFRGIAAMGTDTARPVLMLADAATQFKKEAAG
jgi:hypothetical protein